MTVFGVMVILYPDHLPHSDSGTGSNSINLWRHPSPYGDTFPDLATGVAKARQPRELDHILHSASTGTYAIQEMAGWRNKKGKSGSIATLSSSKMAERASVFPQVAAEVFRLAKQNRLSRYRDVISAVLSRFGDPRRPSAICIALPRYASLSRNSSRATVRHLVVQSKLSRPISPFRDRRGTAILAATAVAKVVQQAH